MAKAVALTGPLDWHDHGERIVADPLRFGDVVLARKDAPSSYHLAVTVDDAAQGVTHVVRGRDLFAATHVHRLLQALLDLPTPDIATIRCSSAQMANGSPSATVRRRWRRCAQPVSTAPPSPPISPPDDFPLDSPSRRSRWWPCRPSSSSS